jgi:BlaI family transcriptional regulator, penicillinase repressor
MKKRIFGELELSILSMMRQSGAKCTVRDVVQALGAKDKYTTIMTVMNRLTIKGELTRERKGQSYQYSLKLQKAHLSLLEKWKTRLFDGKLSQLIGYLLEDQEISSEELTKIERLIKAKRQETSK